jgi:hypothetical protein
MTVSPVRLVRISMMFHPLLYALVALFDKVNYFSRQLRADGVL